MSETQKTIGGREPLNHEIQYIESMSKLLAEESGIDVHWINRTLTKTLPDKPLGADPSTVSPGQFLYRFEPCLFEAMKWFDKEYVVKLFSGDLQQLKIIESRYNSLVGEVPFVNFRDLLPTAKKFQTYLEEEFQTIINTGNPSRPFESSYYLENTFLQNFRHYARRHEATPKSVYLERHKQFTDGILSETFLEGLLGSEYYREYGEVLSAPDFLDAELRDLKYRLKKNLYGKVNQAYTSLRELKNYLDDNKFKVPMNLEKRDELLRTSLHTFSQDALKVFLMVHRNHELGTTLKKIWELVCSMSYEQLDLIFNGNLSYLGIVEYDIDDPSLYTHGRTLIEKVLVAAALEDQSLHSDSLAKIREHLEPVIEDFLDKETGELHPITYSVYQAIDLCGYDSVMSACGELFKAKIELNELKTSLKNNTKRALEISYQQLKELRRNLADLNGIKKKSGDRGFSENYEEYKSPKYGIFQFTSPKMKTAMEMLNIAYNSGDARVSVTELITQLYKSKLQEEIIDSRGRKKERTRDEVLMDRANWRLEKDIFSYDDPVVKYQMLRRGPKKNGERSYILDFSFEEKDPEEFLREIQKEKDQKQAEKAVKDQNKKTKVVEKEEIKQSAKKLHPWNKPGRSSKKKNYDLLYADKGGVVLEGDENDDE